MNRNDKLIVALLFALLMGWLWYSSQHAPKAPPPAAPAPGTTVSTNPAPALLAASTNAPDVVPVPAPPVTTAAPTARLIPEQIVTLRTKDTELKVSSRGGTLLSATLPGYRALPAKGSGPVVLDFNPQPALAVTGLPGIPADGDYSLLVDAGNTVATLSFRTPQGLTLDRRIELRERHQVEVTDRITNQSDAPFAIGTNWVALGTLYRGDSKNDELSADSFAAVPEAKVRHWSDDLQKLFGVNSFGCGKSGAPQPERVSESANGPQRWVALKTRFFAQAFSASVPNAAFRIEAGRNAAVQTLTVTRIDGAVAFPGLLLKSGEGTERSYRIYIGPKKLSYLKTLGDRADAIMEFGFFSWFCKPLLPVLNFFYGLVPNYGVAIVLLTFLVRIVFWPLTHKSTESAKRMRDLQPKLKEVQEKFKDNPQQLQQEIWKTYRENKVNPLSSCLPMLVQLPVFIALYTVLRSAVELRYAPFLWVADLSEPENLFAAVLPVPLNILPLLMAATTVWQSKLTPAMGDPMQQKLMTWMMPLMMLYFFYSMPAALSLYWTVSTLLAIVQLRWQQRAASPATADGPASPAAGAQEGLTRQMRRRLGR